MTNKLPTKLKKEPLVDAVFELRFDASAPVSSIFPGFFFSKLEGNKNIETLPTAELPKHLRDSDPNLQFAPVVRIHWNDDFLISISDRSIAVACKLPYPGWGDFKRAILKVVNLVGEVGIVHEIQRYALKYVDLIPCDDLKERVSYINMEISLGNLKVGKELFQFRVEIPKDQTINVVQIISSGSITLGGIKKEGLVIDIDTIHNVDDQKLIDFLPQLSEQLDLIHGINKQMFFDCITAETLAFLDPDYE
jgi:uncharacterized protein (TIGR04255 family)